MGLGKGHRQAQSLWNSIIKQNKIVLNEREKPNQAYDNVNFDNVGKCVFWHLYHKEIFRQAWQALFKHHN